jgi:diacylglycerol O-acyltransferase
MPDCWPLNPCDYMFLSYDRMMTARGRIGHSTLMVLDLDGEIVPDRLRRALDRVMHFHPITAARIRYSLLSGRPCWTSVDDKPDVLRVVDLRAAADWPAAAHAEMARCLAEPMPVERVPPVRIEYYLGPDLRGKLALRWSHAFADGEGAQWFLAEAARLDRTDGPPPPELCAASDPLDPLAGRRLLDRLTLFKAGFRLHRAHAGVPQTTLGDPRGEAGANLGIHHRLFVDREFETIRTNAKRTCPAGPGLYARYLAGCVLRAIHALYRRSGVETPAYLVTLPVSIRPPGPRPIPGNYLVFATLAARRASVDDPHRLAAELFEQMTRFHADGHGQALWALLWLTGLLRAGQYRWLLRQPIGLQPYVSGFSYYGDVGPPIGQFLGVRVTNLYGVAPLTAPPGWNPIFSRFGARLNLALTWIKGFIPDELAAEFAAEIEREALAAPA